MLLALALYVAVAVAAVAVITIVADGAERVADSGILTVLHTRRLAVCLKAAWGLCWLNEAGCAALQVGPVVVEVVYGG